ncbi:YybH family protein [Chitinophaga sp. 22536]|uniref:YybH family protein n=1 Tax=unclassified Chitinophaga TaxID=2619133 RepID=UPI003F858216
MKQFLMLSLMVLAFSAANGQSEDQPLKAARKAIEASNAIYSDLANKNDGSILTRYTDDACLYPPNAAPVCGKDNIVKFFKNGPKVNSKFTILHLYGDGQTTVTEESHYELTDMKGNKLDDGKVIVIWKKTANGWKMHRDMFSSNHPAK